MVKLGLAVLLLATLFGAAPTSAPSVRRSHELAAINQDVPAGGPLELATAPARRGPTPEQPFCVIEPGRPPARVQPSAAAAHDHAASAPSTTVRTRRAAPAQDHLAHAPGTAVTAATGGTVPADHAHGQCHPTPEQRAAADKLVADVRRVLRERFDIPEKAVLAGYQRGPEPDRKAHYMNWNEQKNARALDPQHPEGIVYENRRVVGAVFMMAKTSDEGPEIGGCLTHWHRHTLDNGEVTSEAMHVWIVPNPHGTFAESAPSEPVR